MSARAVIVFWPWDAEAVAAATLRSAIAGAPDGTPAVLPDDDRAARLLGALPERERSRVRPMRSEAPGLAPFLDVVAAAHPGLDLALVGDAGDLPAGWLERVWIAAHTDDALAAATANAVGGAKPLFDWLEPVAESERPEPGPDIAPPPATPRVLTVWPHCALLRRSAFGLLGGLDAQLSHPRALLADFAARAHEHGLTCTLAVDVLVARPASGLDPFPADERAVLLDRHPWLPAAREDERALEVGALRRSLVAARAARDGLSVTIDARALGSGVGGTQTYIGTLVLALARSGQVSVRAVVAGDTAAEVTATFEAAGVRVIGYEEAANGGVPRSDVVHRPQQVFTPSDLRLLHLLGERLVVSHMDLIAYRTPTYHASVDDWRAYRRTTRLALAAADRVIFFSEHALRDALADDLIAEDRAGVAGLGVSAPRDATAPERPARIPADRELLLLLGSDYTHKNRPFALELVRELRRRHGFDGILVMAGAHVAHGSSAAAERELLLADSDLAAHVVDLGPVSESHKRWLLEAAVAHLCPSSYEGFGLAPLEAAAAGRPCIYAATTSLAEIIDPAAATIVPWDAVASADAAAALLRPGPPRERHMALLGSALKRHGWERVTGRILAVYAEAIASPYRGARPRAWEELEREELSVALKSAYDDLRARVEPGLALIDSHGAMLTSAQQWGLMRVASRRWLRGPLLGGFGLLGFDHRTLPAPRSADGRLPDSSPLGPDDRA